MIKYYASTRFGVAALLSFCVEKETPKRYYIDKESVKHLLGQRNIYTSYVSKDNTHLHDTAKDALESLIETAGEIARGSYKVWQHNREAEENLMALRGQELFI